MKLKYNYVIFKENCNHAYRLSAVNFCTLLSKKDTLFKVPITHSQYLSFQEVETYDMQKQEIEWDLSSISIFNKRSKSWFTK